MDQGMHRKHKSITIALVAGEMSGDLLGAGLIRSLREHYPYAKFVGVGGEEMIAQGLECWYPMNTLSVMGIMAVLKRLPSLLELRKNLIKRILKQQPAVFIGIDAPDFNLGVAKRLRHARIKTVHYVSPSVWAWRQNRVVGIAQSVDLMLTLFPFEREFYLRHGVNAVFVGHPAADDIPLVPSQSQYKERVQTKIDAQNSVSGELATKTLSEGQLLAVLPGSRRSEVEYLGPVFIQTLLWVRPHRPHLRFIIACANDDRRQQMQDIIQSIPQAQALPIYLLVGGARTIMGACDAVLLSSGTATLEAMLMKRPMIVGYKWHWLTHFIISRLVKIKNVALPNILAKQTLVPEFIQSRAKPSLMGPAVLDALGEQKRSAVTAAFAKIHQTLSGDSSTRAAQAIANIIEHSEVSNDKKNECSVAGVDEVGRGPLAGAVVAAAVILDPSNPIEGLTDSKKLTEKKREALFILIQERALAIGVGRAEAVEIDKLNILQASLLAMVRAVEQLAITPTQVLVDGNQIIDVSMPCEAIVGGDLLIEEISAASIIAKVLRDREMKSLALECPQYGFDKHKGYPTAAHLAALREHGPSPHHRRSFKPVSAALRTPQRSK